MTLRAAFHHTHGIRTGTLRIGADHHTLASWHKAADGVMQATTDNGVPITMTNDGRGSGTLTMAGREWALSGIERDGRVVTADAVEEEKPVVVVSDAEMARMFPDCGGG